MNDLSGQVIKGYELRELIGVGGFGAVYRAFQPAIRREVAIKIILPQYANHPEFIRRFEAEARLVARLEHLHIVPLHDYWREPDRAYLVMRWLREGSLRDSLERGPWEVQAVARMLDQIAAALTVAHQHGVVHRDLKPGNILLDEEGNAYLTDFGIAKDLERSVEATQNGGIMGSPGYLSPEQIQGVAVTPQTDIYSLGVMLYELLTGEHPFPGETSVNLIVKHLSDRLPSLHETRPGLSPALDAVIQRATAKEPSARYPDVLSLAAGFRRALAPVEAAVAPAAPPTIEIAAPQIINPYKGLRAFEEADAADFFGREALTEQLLARLASPPASPVRFATGEGKGEGRFLAVVGPSGSGKSSVVKAGLLPALRRGALSGSDKWFVVEMLPGAHPLEELEIGLLRIAANPSISLVEQLRRDARGLLRAARLALPTADSELLLVVDQFEEVFTLVEDRAEAEHFLDSLYATVTDPRGRVRVIITLRADFYDRPLMHPDFSGLVQDHTAVVVPLTTEELSHAIRGPAERVGVTLETGLTTAIVADVSEQPGALPLLQYALTELFERRTDHTLTREAYQSIGGVLGALGRRAEEIYAGLETAGQEMARQLFLRLVTLGEGVEDTRRRVLLGELEAIQTQTSEVLETSEVLKAVIDIFGHARLLSFDRDPLTRGPTVEVAHESLLREWRRLREWLDESRADVRTQRLLAAAAREWIGADRDPGFLLRGSRLDQFKGWSTTTDLALTGAEREYLDASLAEQEARRVEEAARQAREAALERRSRTVLRALVGLFAVAAVVAIILTGIAFNSQGIARENALLAGTAAADARAQSERADAAAAQALEQKAVAEQEARAALEAYSLSLTANAREALNDRDPLKALLLALAANRIEQPPVESQRTLLEAAYAPGARQRFVVEEVFTGVVGPALSVDISPDGRTALVGLFDGTVILWDISAALNTGMETGQEIRRFQGHTNRVGVVAFSPDGETALSGSIDGNLILWDIAAALNTGLQTGREIRRFEGHSGRVWTAAFSPDGRTALSGGPASGEAIVVAENPGELILWDLETGQEIRRFEGHTQGVLDVAFSPDGHTALASSGVTLYTGSEQVYELILWDVESGEPVWRVEGLDHDNISIAISPDGATALTSSRDGNLYLWDLRTGQQTGILEGHNNRVKTVAINPGGRRAISGDENGNLILWDLESGEQIVNFKVHTRQVNGVAVSPDGRTAISVSGDGTMILWDLFGGGEINRFEGHTSQVFDGYHARWEVLALRFWQPQTRASLPRCGQQPAPVEPGNG